MRLLLPLLLLFTTPLLAQSVVVPQVLEAPPPPSVEGEVAGVVVVPVRLEVDTDGAVRSVSLEEAVAYADVATAAVTHAASIRFSPATRGGSPIASTLRYDVRVEVRARATVEARPDPTIDRAPTEPTDGEGFGAVAEVPLGVTTRPTLATSELRLELRALRDVPRYHAEQLLSLVPGAVLGNHGGEGKASNLYLRGFDAGEGQDVEVLVEGIPINEPSNAHEHGYADTFFLIPELVREVRVLPGPFDPAQGDFALAGTIDHRLGLDTRGVRALGGYGSFRRRRALLAWSSGPNEGRDDDFVAFEVQAGRGFGANRAHRLYRGLARFGGGDARLGWSLLAASHALEFDSAGVVRQDAVDARTLPCGDTRDAQRFCTHDATQGGSAQRHLVLAKLRWQRPGQRFEPRVWAQLRRSRFRENYTFFLGDPRGDALDEQTESVTVGVRADYVAETEWRGRAQQLELGVLARHDRGDVRTWRLRAGTLIPYDTVFDTALSTTQAGAYVAAIGRVPRVTLRAGARVAAFTSSATDRNLPTVDREGERVPRQTADAFGIAVLPRGTLTVALTEAEASRLDWTTSVGLGARSSDAQALSDGEDAPFARSITSETGLRSQARLGDLLAFDGRLGAFWTRVDRDLLFDPEAGRNVPVGATQRYGAFLSLQLAVPRWFELLGSFSWSEAHLSPDGAGTFELTRGPRLPFVPRLVGRVDAAFRRPVRIRRERVLIGAALGGSVIGRKPLPLGELSERIAVLDGSVRFAWRFAELALLVRNVTGARYRQLELSYASRLDPDDPAASLRAARHVSMGAPREVLLQLTVHFDPNAFVGEEPQTDSETNSDSDSDSETETETDTESDSDAETETETETETASESDSVSDTDSISDTESVSDTESESESDTGSESVTGTDTGSVSDSDDSDSDAATGTDSAPRGARP